MRHYLLHTLTSSLLCLIGSTAAAATLVTDERADETVPCVAHSSNADRFLTIWEHRVAANDVDLRARLMTSAGAVTGSSSMDVAGGAGMQYRPACAGGPDRFFVAYQQFTGNGIDIYGRILDQDGRLVSRPFLIATGTLETSPAIAYDPTFGGFLVVWEHEDTPADRDIFGRFFTAYGEPLSSSFPVSYNGSNDEFHPDVGASTDGYFLVVWQTEFTAHTSSIDGRWLRLTSATQSSVGPFLQIKPPTLQHRRPAVAGNAVGHFFVAWEEEEPFNNSFEIWGRRVDTSMSMSMPLLLSACSQETGHAAYRPDVSADPHTNGWLVVWEESVTVRGDELDIRGRKVLASCVMEPSSLYLAYSPENDGWPALPNRAGTSGALLVWEYESSASNHDIWSRLVP